MQSIIPAELVRGGIDAGGWNEEASEDDMVDFAGRPFPVGDDENARGETDFQVTRVPQQIEATGLVVMVLARGLGPAQVI